MSISKKLEDYLKVRRQKEWLRQHGCDSCCPRCEQWESDGNKITTNSQDDGTEHRQCSKCGYEWVAVFTPTGFVKVSELNSPEERADHWYNEGLRLANQVDDLERERDVLIARSDMLEDVMLDVSAAKTTVEACTIASNAIDQLPMLTTAHIRAQGAKELLQRALAESRFSVKLIEVAKLESIVESMEKEK